MEELVGDAIMGIVVASAVVHSASFLLVLGSTGRRGAVARIGMLVGSLVPLLGPVLAIVTAWASRGRR
ncbi:MULTISPECIES: hypothetical protein [Arthrobacter]|uniref:Uncharacterized protein n=1 Tax=Arthrobacter subterraneus TaxID=335973 RepID=A0A1G8CM74_9MICC|nr:MULTISPECIES: hypothetical protein [Arthrobacter]AOY70837.1 hypothetical protein ARZXY2_1284 [Arthrobacter sp. ZXY-2]MCW2134172.1 hypothetical protein [Arthrobacter sp. VKM Ac-2550]SDH46535.1 hypothetical protein SAMN04488693_101321 [Arthrobacter subterraneus]